jgi:hypothetical protein
MNVCADCHSQERECSEIARECTILSLCGAGRRAIDVMSL